MQPRKQRQPLGSKLGLGPSRQRLPTLVPQAPVRASQTRSHPSPVSVLGVGAPSSPYHILQVRG